MEVYGTIEYVNARDGRRPASIKVNGSYYGISDDAYLMLMPMKGQDVHVQYETTERGFKNALSVNGQQLPRMGGAPKPSGARPAAAYQSAAPARQRTGPSRAQIIGSIARSCIEAGLSRDEFRAWVAAVAEEVRGGKADARKREEEEKSRLHHPAASIPEELLKQRLEQEKQHEAQQRASEENDPDDDIPF